MIGGVSFQPGSLQQEQNRRQSQNGTAQGVQEAIKVLSLRLPKVVGAQATAPQALLQSPGAGGNSRVDSIVQSVMQKFFPQGGTSSAPMIEQTPGAPPQGPSAQPESPNVSGAPSPFQAGAPQENFLNRFPSAPRIITDLPQAGSLPEAPFTGGPNSNGRNIATWDGGMPNFGGGMIAPLPDLRQQLDWLPEPGAAPEQPLI